MKHTYSHKYTLGNTCIHTHISILHIHIYICTHIYTYMHTHTFMELRSCLSSPATSHIVSFKNRHTWPLSKAANQSPSTKSSGKEEKLLMYDHLLCVWSYQCQDGRRVLNLGFIWPDGDSLDTNLIYEEKSKTGDPPFNKIQEGKKTSKYIIIPNHYDRLIESGTKRHTWVSLWGYYQEGLTEREDAP